MKFIGLVTVALFAASSLLVTVALVWFARWVGPLVTGL